MDTPCSLYLPEPEPWTSPFPAGDFTLAFADEADDAVIAHEHELHAALAVAARLGRCPRCPSDVVAVALDLPGCVEFWEAVPAAVGDSGRLALAIHICGGPPRRRDRPASARLGRCAPCGALAVVVAGRSASGGAWEAAYRAEARLRAVGPGGPALPVLLPHACRPDLAGLIAEAAGGGPILSDGWPGLPPGSPAPRIHGIPIAGGDGATLARGAGL